MLINENYKVESDALNVTVFYRAAGKKTWMPIGYFSNPQNALNFLVINEIMGAGMKDMETVCKKIDELTRLINSLEIPTDALRCLTGIVKEDLREKVHG